MNYLIVLAFVLLEALLIISAQNFDFDKATPWLLGLSFTITFFSINFTFFGYQLSKYKLIYSRITARQWLNISIQLCLPLLNLIAYLAFSVETSSILILLTLPLLLLSCLNNASLVINYLSPSRYIEATVNPKLVSQYLDMLVKELIIEVKTHESNLENSKKYQLPMHARSYSPGIYGIEPKDIWDSLTLIIQLSQDNNDYPVFRQSLRALLNLTLDFYSFESKSQEYRVASGINEIARTRLRSIISSIFKNGKNEIFLYTLSNELCAFLRREDIFNNPTSSICLAISSDLVWIAEQMLENKNVIEPMNILNILHSILEAGCHGLFLKDDKDMDIAMGRQTIGTYVYQIKTLAESALKNENSHFAYRCMETLSYIGCNAAKLKADNVIIATLESIVQVARLARNLKIGCFWSRCLIPAENHAEEFMGHIMTWLIHDLDSKGNFYLKNYAEQAYSRLRGYECEINPDRRWHPCFWIKELEEDGHKIPHIESESGMYGYGGSLDYSDYSNLKEHVLYGLGRGQSIIRGSPIKFEAKFEDDK